MKVYVLVDMEGASGIVRPGQCDSSTAEYQTARRYLTWDVNACVAGCFDGGAGQVTVRDIHSGGANIIWEELDPRAALIQQGWDAPVRLPALADYQAVVLLGYHAMAGTPGAILEHTMSSGHWQNFWINGKKSGEIAIDAALAGDCDIPVILVTGSEKACAEARRFIKGVVTAPVKKDLDVYGGILLPKDTAHDLIRTRAAQAVRNANNVRPYKVKRPVRMRIEKTSRSRLPEARPFVKVIDGRTFEVEGRNVEDALNRLTAV